MTAVDSARFHGDFAAMASFRSNHPMIIEIAPQKV